MAKSFVKSSLAVKFDRAGVFGAIDKKDKNVLRRTGAYGRQVMRRGQRRKKGVSNPSGYPNAHSGELRDLVFFNHDAAADEVIIGPALFAGTKDPLPAGVTTVPQLINEGGTVRKEIGPPQNRRVAGLVYKRRPFVELSTTTTADRMFKLYNDLPLKK